MPEELYVLIDEEEFVAPEDWMVTMLLMGLITIGLERKAGVPLIHPELVFNSSQ